MLRSGLTSQSASRLLEAPTRYGGIVASSDALRSRHFQAMSVRLPPRPFQFGVCHSPGHPDHADGRMVGGGMPGMPGSTCTPFGSPGLTFGGPTVPGAACAGVLSFGVSGGWMARVKKPNVEPHYAPERRRSNQRAREWPGLVRAGGPLLRPTRAP